MTSTEKAVAQLRAYAKYMDENAEDIIGSIDKPVYVTTDGLRFSFTLLEHDAVPTLTFEKEYIVLDVLEAES